MNVLPAYMYVHYACAWLPERLEYGIRLPETGIQGVCEMPSVGTEKNPVPQVTANV